tara:strand:- start:345 stop:659 length:315 start_codon:yes stop_codon:yes gene_type:complete
MGRLFTFIIGFFLISSCAEYTNNLSPSAKARSEYISTCFEMTPGGQSYKEACACGFDRGMQLMTASERNAYLRGFNEIQDLEYIISAPAKLLEATLECGSEAFE